MSEVKSWSTTAASNNSASPDGFPEAMAPSGVNDSAREVMAAIARYRADTDGVASSTGSANAYVLASATTYAAYAQGDRFCFKANFANTGAATLNVDAVGAKAIKRLDGSALEADDIQSGAMVDVIYDGTNFLLLNRFVDLPDAATTSAAGIVELATDAEALAGSDTARAVTSAGLASDQTKSAKGHTVLPGGLLLNWGKVTFAAATGPLTDTFDKAFSGTPYSLVLGNTMGNAARITTFTTTTIGITMSGSSTGDVYFWAIGPA